MASELGTKPFSALSTTEQKDVQEKAEERYLSYVFLRQSGKQHNKVKVDLQKDFTTGDDRYPKNRQLALHLLDKYSKTTIVTKATSEGTAFAQRGGRDGNGGNNGKHKQKPFDTKWWKDRASYHCDKKGHPSTHCPEKKNIKSGGSKTSDDKTSRSSKSSKASITKMHKKMKKAFTTLQSKIGELENEDSDLTSSDSDEE